MHINTWNAWNYVDIDVCYDWYISFDFVYVLQEDVLSPPNFIQGTKCLSWHRNKNFIGISDLDILVLFPPVITTVGIRHRSVQEVFHKTLIMENINGKKWNLSCCRKISFYALSPMSPFPSQGSKIALIINCSISLSTGCLLLLIIAFHYKDIRVSLCFPLCFQQFGRPYCDVACAWVRACVCACRGALLISRACHIVCITFKYQ